MAKGHKTGGRKSGTPNRISSELKSVLKNIVHDELEQLPESLQKLNPKDRIELLLKLIPYVLPRLNNVHDFGG